MDSSKVCADLRKKIFLTGYRGGMAHLASCFSAVEILYTLYLEKILRYRPEEPDWPDRDRFVLSKGHAALALYAVLCKAGCLPESELHAYLQPGCHIGGEPCTRDLSVIEATTGSLGHGLPMAEGMAMSQKLDRRQAKTYVLLGDGECEEGSVWEAAMLAPAFGLDNLVAIVDQNGLQKTKQVEQILGGARWAEKWRAFGWTVREVDGHDVSALAECLSLPAQEGRPTLVLAHTVKGKGVSLMENAPAWHFKMPNSKELPVFRRELHIEESELA